MQEGLFGQGGQPEQDAYLRRVQAFAAPVAADRGAVVDDPEALNIAEAVYGAFGDTGVSGGLTRAQIGAACRTTCDVEAFQSRFEVFVGMGMLMPIFDKANQQRYIFNVSSAAGLLVWQRLAERGGVDELINLLDRTRMALEARTASRADVLTNLRASRRWLTIAADHLFQMVGSSPLGELIAVRRHHSQGGLIDKVHALSRIVADVFSDLDPEAYRVLQAAMRYNEAREAFVSRLLDEGATARDFSLLDHEEYLEAALTRTVGELAEVFADMVLDGPSPWVDAATVSDAVLTQRPRARTKERPPRPTVIESPTDPIEYRMQLDADARHGRARRIELLMQDRTEVDAQASLRSAGWPAAAVRVADLLAASADPNSPFRVTLSDEFLVDPDGPVTYLTPVTVHRSVTVAVRDAGLAAMSADDGVHATDGADSPHAPDAALGSGARDDG